MTFITEDLGESGGSECPIVAEKYTQRNFPWKF